MSDPYYEQGYFDPNLWQHGFNPSPAVLAQAMYELKDLVVRCYIALPPWITVFCAPPLRVTRDSQVRTLIALFSRVGRTDWTVDDDDLFLSYVETKFDGWDDETWAGAACAIRAVLQWGKLHGDDVRPMPELFASRILAQAQRVRDKIDQIQADLNRHCEVGRKQRENAIAAGNSRVLLTSEQKRTAANEIASLIASGTTEQMACKQLAPKYGVHFRTLKRYYQGRENTTSRGPT